MSFLYVALAMAIPLGTFIFMARRHKPPKHQPSEKHPRAWHCLNRD
jgi:hypothetical protein